MERITINNLPKLDRSSNVDLQIVIWTEVTINISLYAFIYNEY